MAYERNQTLPCLDSTGSKVQKCKETVTAGECFNGILNVKNFKMKILHKNMYVRKRIKTFLVYHFEKRRRFWPIRIFRDRECLFRPLEFFHQSISPSKSVC
jgi:hypothetical protein